MLVEKFNHTVIEKKWRSYWDTNNVFKTSQDRTKKNFIALRCFPIHQVKFTWDM